MRGLEVVGLRGMGWVGGCVGLKKDREPLPKREAYWVDWPFGPAYGLDHHTDARGLTNSKVSHTSIKPTNSSLSHFSVKLLGSPFGRLSGSFLITAIAV